MFSGTRLERTGIVIRGNCAVRDRRTPGVVLEFAIESQLRFDIVVPSAVARLTERNRTIAIDEEPG